MLQMALEYYIFFMWWFLNTCIQRGEWEAGIGGIIQWELWETLEKEVIVCWAHCWGGSHKGSFIPLKTLIYPCTEPGSFWCLLILQGMSDLKTAAWWIGFSFLFISMEKMKFLLSPAPPPRSFMSSGYGRKEPQQKNRTDDLWWQQFLDWLGDP